MKRIGKPYRGTQAVLRGMFLLKSFTDEKPSWTLAALSKNLKLNKTTVYRLLTALESEGLIRRNPDGESYALGPEMVILGARAMRSYTLRDVCHDPLKEIAESSGETATLEIFAGSDVLILDEIRGAHLLGAAPSLGTRWPAFATSTGKAMMAHMAEDEVEDILKGPLIQYTPKTITDPSRLRKEFVEIRKRGYAVADEALELGFRAIGAALFQHNGELAGAISLGGPVVRFPLQRLSDFGKLISGVAAKISTRLGHKAGL
jgi:IclR family transcriptional regulator, acetate operon repressor